MVITTKGGRSYDTDRDLSAPERHILQKLIMWEQLASSLDEFREKKATALLKGWNDSGPIRESDALRAILSDWEEKVLARVGH